MKNKEYYIRLGEAVQKLEEKNCPTDPSKWSYYKSQAKEKFDVYPSAYANGWASKQYGDAGGGWKKCENEATDAQEKEFHNQLDKLVHKTFGKSPDEEKMDEKFDKTHLGILKYAYKDIDRINPSDPMYIRVTQMLDKLSKQELQQLIDADIKFISLLAKNRLSKKESVNESHFQVGDKVKMSHGGVGVVKSLDKEDGADDEKYYNIELPNGEVMKHAPNELTLVEADLEEGLFQDIMRAVKKGDGPFTLVVIKNNKVVKQVEVKTPQAIPANYSSLLKDFPNTRIRIEDATGKIVMGESLNEKLPNDFSTIPNNSRVDGMMKHLQHHVDVIRKNVKAGKGVYKKDLMKMANIIKAFQMYESKSVNEGVINELSADTYKNTVKAALQRGDSKGNSIAVQALQSFGKAVAKELAGKSFEVKGSKDNLAKGFYRGSSQKFINQFKMTFTGEGELINSRDVKVFGSDEVHFRMKVEFQVPDNIGGFSTDVKFRGYEKYKFPDSIQFSIKQGRVWAWYNSADTDLEFTRAGAREMAKLADIIVDAMDFPTKAKHNTIKQFDPMKVSNESVNEDTKKRFDVDFYKIMGDRQTSHEEIIRGDKFSDVISQATKVAKSKGMNYVEFYYKDSFIGSIDKRNNYTFKKGRNSEKSPLSVNEASIDVDTYRKKQAFVIGPKFAEVASDNDVELMARLKRANSDHAWQLKQNIASMDHLYKKYKIRSKKGIEESVVNESSVEIGDIVFLPSANSAATVVDRFGRSVTVKLANGKKIKTVVDKIKLLAQDNVNEGSFSEIDIMAREARNFNDFVKEFYKDFKDFPKDKETFKWLKSLYDGRSTDESVSESHTGDPSDRYIVRPCKNPKEPWAVWEGEVRVKGFATKEEADAFAAMKNKEQGLTEGNAFTGALFKARKEGLTEFEFNGKKYPVHKLEEEESLTESKLTKDSLKQIIKEEYHNVKNFMEEKYGFTPELGKVYSNLAAKPFLKEEEEEVVDEYDVENYQDLKEFVQFMAEYKSDINEAEYQGRKVKLGKIMQGDVKKFKVYVKNDKGNVVKVNFGQGGDAKGGTMRIRKDNPEARKSFRARHNCDNPGPRWKARYWSCRKW